MYSFILHRAQQVLWPALCVAVRKSILAAQPQAQDGGEQLRPVVEEDQGA